MGSNVSRRAVCGAGVAAGIAALPLPFVRTRAAEPLRLRCSLDTAPSHGRNVAITDFLAKLSDAAGGRLHVEIFPSGQLYNDIDVVKALLQGQVEMAAPGTWAFSGLLSNADVFAMPAFYGLPIEALHRSTDGKAGRRLISEVEAKLCVHVLGPFLDVGFQNWYTIASRPIASGADLKGLKIRSPGGAALAHRIDFYHAIPQTTAWPNVPLSLSQGTFDGLISTDDSCVTAHLWESGLKHSYVDRGGVGEYVPMVSAPFWAALPADLQSAMTELWQQHIGDYRQSMLAAQTSARRTLASHGMNFYDPDDAELARLRQQMMAGQDALARECKVSPDILALAMADLAA